MKPARYLKSLLISAGAIAAGIGAALLIAPVAFEASAGVALADDPGLLSEIRSMGGMLLAFGGLILAGGFSPRLALTATVSAAGLYLAFGISRLVSLSVDGSPGRSILAAAAIELATGSLCAIALYRNRRAAWPS